MATNFDKVGIEQQVNVPTINNNESDPDVAAVSNGDFFVVFEREFTPGADIDIRGQFVNADGTLSGAQVTIDNGAGFQINPAVAARLGGGATIVWLDQNDSDEIEFRTVNNAGVTTAEFDVLTGGPYVNSPDLAQLADGRVLVVAQQNNAGNQDIVFNFINAAANATTGAGFIDNAANNQITPAAAAFGNNALVVYLDDTAGNSDLVARFFNGTAFGAEFTIANATQALDSPDVAALTDGRFITVWSNDDTDNLSARFVSATGAPLGGVFSIAGGGGDQDSPRVAALPDGGFIVTWQDNSGTIAPDNIGGPDQAVHARRFDAAGNPAGDEFLVNSFTTNDQLNPAAAVNLTNGTGYIAWDDFGTHTAPQDDDPPGVRGQAFQTNTDVVNGTAGSDLIQTYGLGEVINGLGGDDQVFAGAGNDAVDGGPGNDILLGEDGDDNLGGLAGNDILVGGEGNDTIGGDDGNDVLSGDAGADVMFGGNGNDFMSGGTGDDILVGQDGADLMDGDAGNDNMNGGAGSDILVGGLGNDTIGGGGDNDVVVGNEGEDQLFGEDGADQMAGGDGNDTMVGGNGDDVMGGGIGDDVMIGDAGNDGVFGEDGNDNINVGDGNDVVLGGNGNDTIGGGTGDDALRGEAGDDVLFGETGNDFLTGGTGNDVMVTGSGNDVLVFTAGDGNDTVTDFVAGGADDLIILQATSLASFGAVLAATTIVGGNAVITYNGANTITLNGVSSVAQLTASDFAFL